MQGRDVMHVLPLIFGEQCNSLHEVAYAATSLSVQGYITVPPTSFGHNHRQYLYVNNRHVRAAQLGKLVNSLFRRIMSNLERPEELHGKASHQYPAFALQITCPHSSYDITSEPDKSHVEFADWPAVLAAMQAAVLDAWHSVAGDKLLAELLRDQHCKAGVPAIAATASASTEHATTASSQFESQLLPLSESKARHSAPAVIGMKRKRDQDQDQASCFIDTDVVSVNSLFDKSIGQHKCGTSTDLTANTGSPGSANDIQDDLTLQCLPPQAAPGGLLHRLQSSVKLKFAQVPPAELQNQSHQQQEPAVSLTAKDLTDAGHLDLASLLHDEPEAQPAMPWSPSRQQYSNQGLPAAISQDFDADQALASSLVLPATSCWVDAPSHHDDTQVRAGSSRSTHQHARAISAPPHYRTQHRSAHTNPLHSLHTDLHKLVLSHTASARVPDLTWQAPSTAEQAPRECMMNSQARQKHTVSGVCNQLRRQLGNSKQAQLSEVYRQKRNSRLSRSCLKPAQMPNSEHPAVADNAVHDSLLPVQSDAQQLRTLKHWTSGKRVWFEPSMDDSAPANDCTAEPLPSVPTSYIPTSPHSTLPAAQPPNQQGPCMPMTATPSASVVTGQPAQPVEPEANDSLTQQTSLAVPSITELLQSWSNPSICPQGSRSIADLASVCGTGLHAVVPTAITRSDFTQAQTLRQMENKFIAVVCNGMLSVIDQHAADERVRLERLRAAILGSQVGRPILSFTKL